MPQRVFITGASRGLGLELTRQYLARGAQVFAACRCPEKADNLRALTTAASGQLIVLRLDVTNENTIDMIGRTVGAQADGLEVLINNAALGPTGPAEALTTVSSAALIEMFRVNAFGPLLVARRLADLLQAGRQPRLVNISSDAGSLAAKQGGGWYGYGGSKAALNLFTRALAADLRDAGIIVIAMHPGWVRTDMGGSQAPLLPTDAVRQILAVVDRLTLADTSKFYSYEGREYAW